MDIPIVDEQEREVDEICPNCGAENCYAWDDCNDPKDSDFDANFDKVYHIPSCSGFEWTCGNCGLSFCDVNSPINAEVYTHIDPDFQAE